MTMNFLGKVICATLCGATLLAPLAISQIQNTAPPPLKGVQPQNGLKRQGQQQTPASSDPRLRASGMRIKPGSQKSGPKISNPHAAMRDAAVIAVLQRQKQAADIEAAQIKIGIRPAGQAGLPAVQSPMSSPGVNSPNKAKAPAPANIQKSPAMGTIGPGRVSEAPGNSSSLSIQSHQIDTTVLTCGHDPTVRILKVSGDAQPATFTPDMKYNFYTITGCSFGNFGPNAQVYVYKGGAFHQKFQIQEWNENWIKLNLDPALSGVLDQDNLTLVVQRADGMQASKSGFKFYAARETRLLHQISQQYFSLDKFRPDNAATSNWQVTYTSPSSSSVEPFFASLTAEVRWLFPGQSELSSNKFDPYVLRSGDDFYDFSHLQPGFTPDSAWMEWSDIGCDPGNLVTATTGKFAIEWTNDNRLHVFWTGEICKVHQGGFGVQSDDFQEQPGSMYGVNVWVTGPRGVDPWTGNQARP